MDRRYLLEEPFRSAFEFGDSIDYRLVKGKSDHEYVRKHGFIPEMHSDCSYSADGLRGISLASYGDWGTVFTRDLDVTSGEIFLDMVELGIIKPWRIRAYREGNTYDYECDNDSWCTYDDETKKWVQCTSPYVMIINNQN